MLYPPMTSNIGRFLYDHFSVLIDPSHPLHIYVSQRNYKRYQADIAYIFEQLCAKLNEKCITFQMIESVARMKLRDESWIYALCDDKELAEKTDCITFIPEAIRDLAPSAFEYITAIRDFVTDYRIIYEPKEFRDTISTRTLSSIITLWISLNLRAISTFESTSVSLL